MSGNIDNLQNIISMYDNVLIFSLVDAQLRPIKEEKGLNIKIKRKKERRQRR